MESRARTAPSPGAFLIRLPLAALGLFVVYWLCEASGAFGLVNSATAEVAGRALDWLGHPNRRAGSMLCFLDSHGLQIVSECTGVYAAILFLAGVLAFPTTWKARLVGLAVGLPILLLVNLARLVALGLLVGTSSRWMPFFHEYVWQVLFVGLVVGLYLLWIRWMVPREPAAPSP
jgi:archaeosortase B (VPXXXP-CTERM-specific)